MNIKGMNKAKILAALYNASNPPGIFYFDPTPMTEEEAEAILDHGSNFDYLKGRVMKVDLSGDELNTWLYNRDNGPNAAEKAIASIT